MRELLARTLGEDIALRVKPAPDVPTVRIDANQLANALIALAINARHAMPGGGTVTLATRLIPPAGDAPTRVALTMADSGVAIPDEVRDRVFEPFFKTKPVGERTGLGLSHVYGFATQAGGDVGIDSEAGRGTTVKIRLPGTTPSRDAA